MTRPTAVVLARISWICPLVSFLAGIALRPPAGTTVSADPYEQGRAEGQVCGLLLFYLVGLVLGIVALSASRAHGPAKIRTPALVGVVLNIALLTAAVVLMVR